MKINNIGFDIINDILQIKEYFNKYEYKYINLSKEEIKELIKYIITYYFDKNVK